LSTKSSAMSSTAIRGETQSKWLELSPPGTHCIQPTIIHIDASLWYSADYDADEKGMVEYDLKERTKKQHCSVSLQSILAEADLPQQLVRQSFAVHEQMTNGEDTQKTSTTTAGKMELNQSNEEKDQKEPKGDTSTKMAVEHDDDEADAVPTNDMCIIVAETQSSSIDGDVDHRQSKPQPPAHEHEHNHEHNHNHKHDDHVDENWKCSICAYQNAQSALKCQMCGCDVRFKALQTEENDEERDTRSFCFFISSVCKYVAVFICFCGGIASAFACVAYWRGLIRITFGGFLVLAIYAGIFIVVVVALCCLLSYYVSRDRDRDNSSNVAVQSAAVRQFECFTRMRMRRKYEDIEVEPLDEEVQACEEKEDNRDNAIIERQLLFGNESRRPIPMKNVMSTKEKNTTIASVFVNDVVSNKLILKSAGAHTKQCNECGFERQGDEDDDREFYCNECGKMDH